MAFCYLFHMKSIYMHVTLNVAAYFRGIDEGVNTAQIGIW